MVTQMNLTLVRMSHANRTLRNSETWTGSSPRSLENSDKLLHLQLQSSVCHYPDHVLAREARWYV